jgi:hypothetical protein
VVSVVAVIFGAPAPCAAIDVNGDGVVSIADLVSVMVALSAPGAPSPTPTATPSRTASPTASPTPTITASPTPVSPGPVITFFGLTSASNHLLTPSKDPQGNPVYSPPAGGAQFFIVVEAKPGSSGASPGVKQVGADAASRPDLQILANRDLGNGSAAVCDVGPTPDFPIGGVPGFNPPNFDDPSQSVTDALNDFGCRFDNNTFLPCTLNANDIYAFVAPGTTTQFCTRTVVGHEMQFPSGDTLLTVRWRDTSGNIGLPARLVVHVP